MALEKTQVQQAVKQAGYSDHVVAFSLKRALRIIRILYSEMPWYKKVFLTVRWLVKGLEAFTDEIYEKERQGG